MEFGPVFVVDGFDRKRHRIGSGKRRLASHYLSFFPKGLMGFNLITGVQWLMMLSILVYSKR
jgi:hypothetical protein